MNAATRKKITALDKLRLPELQEQFAEIVGEATRSPNKKYLIRRIREALVAAESTGSSAPKRPATPTCVPSSGRAARRAPTSSSGSA